MPADGVRRKPAWPVRSLWEQEFAPAETGGVVCGLWARLGVQSSRHKIPWGRRQSHVMAPGKSELYTGSGEPVSHDQPMEKVVPG